MKIRTLIDNVQRRYQVQVETFGFTANEEQKLADFGEPLIEAGGAFSGSVSRPGATNTTVSIGGDGSNATAVPVVSLGAVTLITVTNTGTGYTTAPVTIIGDGAGAAATPRFGLAGTSIAFTPAGTGYAPGDTLVLDGVDPEDVPIQLVITTVDGVGAVTAASIANRGEFLAVPSNPIATWTTNGAGLGFSASITTWGVVSVVVTAGGSGYNVVPLPVSFTLPTATRRLRTDSPFKQVFDLNDSVDADAQAKLWADTMAARLLAAKNTLMNQESPFEGETVITG